MLQQKSQLVVRTLDAISSNTNTDKIYASGSSLISLLAATSGTATLTLKVKGSIGSTCPDFSSAASRTNPWFYVSLKRYDTAAVVAGATGIAWTGTDSVIGAALNIEGLDWLAFEVTGYAAGALTISYQLA